MLDREQILVIPCETIPKADKASNGSSNSNLADQVLVDTGLENSSKVVDESILASMLLPVVMSVDSATIFAACFSKADILDVIKVTLVSKGVPSCTGWLRRGIGAHGEIRVSGRHGLRRTDEGAARSSKCQ